MEQSAHRLSLRDHKAKERITGRIAPKKFTMKLVTILVSVLSVGLATANSVCPGAPSTSYGNGMLGCTAPICLMAGGGFRPSMDPTKYFVCAGPNISYEMKCAPGTCFSYEYQTCVHPRDWTDHCMRSLATTTTTTTTTAKTTTSTTTTPATTTTTTTPSPTVATPDMIPNESDTGAPYRTLNICNGTDPSTVTYGSMTCQPFQCNAELAASKERMPYIKPEYFYFCHDEKILGIERCPGNTCFDYGLRKCVPPSEWTNYCEGTPVL